MAGTSNFLAHEQSEIIHLVENVSSINEIESRYRCVRIKDIQQDIEFSACFVKGTVTTVYPSFQTSRGWTMKVSIKDAGVHDPANPRDAISVFLKGQFVEKCKMLREKDLLVIAGAQLEKSSMDEGHEFNIMANESKDLKIWIVQDPENKTTGTESVPVQKPLPLESGTTTPAKKLHKTGNGENEPPSKRSRLVLRPLPEKYTKLADLTVNTVVNVYGVVKFFKSPFKTKGFDFVCTLSLVDPSLDSLDKSLKCVLFSKSKESLPLVKSVGDVVRIHHLGVGQYQGELQGKLMPDSSWVVFDINSSDTPQVRSPSSRSYNLTDDEKDTIEELRSWTLHKSTLNKRFTITTLKDLSTSQTFINLLAQVVAKRHTEKGSVVLTLWDGSRPACQSILVEPISEQGQIMSDELMRKAAKRCVELFLYDNHATGDARRVCPGDFVCIRNVHLKGRDSDGCLTADQPEATQSRPLVSLEVHKGTICGRGVEIISGTDPVVTSSAMMKFIPETEALMMQQEQSDAIESKTTNNNGPPSDVCNEAQEKSAGVSSKGGHDNANVESRALQTSCTITEHPCIPFTSLHDIKACDTVPNKFRCRVKAVKFLPSDVKDFVRRACQSCRYTFADCSGPVSSDVVDVSASPVLCTKCNQETTLVYLISFIIEDESALLHAMVFDKDVAAFFPDLPSPQDFLGQSSFQETTSEWMLSMTQNPDNSLEFVNQDPRCDKRPWLELCILSYRPQGNESRGQVLYRVFDSTFVADIQ